MKKTDGNYRHVHSQKRPPKHTHTIELLYSPVKRAMTTQSIAGSHKSNKTSKVPGCKTHIHTHAKRRRRKDKEHTKDHKDIDKCPDLVCNQLAISTTVRS
jgi:hypothetical protein